MVFHSCGTVYQRANALSPTYWCDRFRSIPSIQTLRPGGLLPEVAGENIAKSSLVLIALYKCGHTISNIIKHGLLEIPPFIDVDFPRKRSHWFGIITCDFGLPEGVFPWSSHWTQRFPQVEPNSHGPFSWGKDGKRMNHSKDGRTDFQMKPCKRICNLVFEIAIFSAHL